ncbi:hypothetical protein QBC35DRAFT_392435 [Podospora australis]|uniref:Uncharacterized protein n=1 Tax=Podospora australis TaxID=1536484 RepID=A0AAN6WM07_9PEZI|nr:hypothetical protein QBC35DRAFT_392435 [Podospora australis]
MLATTLFTAAVAGLFGSAAAIGITPHEQFSSSAGVLGCKIDTNRVAYWPMAVDCNNICVKVTHRQSGRSLNLLRIDQSGGAYDISYDAWNYLVSGRSTTESPQTGGAVDMDIQNVPADNCRSLIRTSNGGLPIAAANGFNFFYSCFSQPASWVARHYQLVNIMDQTCHCGWDEVCTFTGTGGANQPTCPHTLGSSGKKMPDTVFNIQYGTGVRYPAPGLSACPGA